MAILEVKGCEIKSIVIKDSFYRKALFFKNSIIGSLRRLGLTEDDVSIDVEKVAMKKVIASAAWYFEGYHLYYSYKGANNYAENLYVVSKVIDEKVDDLINDFITVEEFIRDFSEDTDVEEQRLDARRVLGLPEDILDLDEINLRYKSLAKKFHPDMPTGDLEEFKRINHAHKMLKRELA